MREIKFRAYIKKDYNPELVGKILEVSSLHLKKNKAIIGYSISNSNYGNHSFNYEDIELMQYTGLKDKNGKEIYERDIVKINDEIIAKVIWDNDYLGYFLYANEENSIDSFENGEQPLYDYWGSIEVIGNIYDNSELLEEGE